MSEAAVTPAPRSRAADVLAGVFSPITGALALFGDHMLLLSRAAAWLVRPPFRPKVFFEAMEYVGVGSLVIILMVGFSSGAVAALQAIFALSIFHQEYWTGAAVGLSLAQELAPVFTSLMITARAGSGMATELGSMRITEQVDALTTFAVNPIQYLVTPRIVAGILMVPVMTMVFNIVGLLGGYVVAVFAENVDPGQFLERYRFWTDPTDYIIGLTKSAVFGLTLALVACYQGFNVRGGAKEVGLATTRAVVAGCVATIILDYFLTKVLSLYFSKFNG